jgi:hypothetical protein
MFKLGLAAVAAVMFVASPASADKYYRGGFSADKRAKLEALMKEEREDTLGERPSVRHTDRGIQRTFLPVPRGCKERRERVEGRHGVPGRTHVRVECDGRDDD